MNENDKQAYESTPSVKEVGCCDLLAEDDNILAKTICASVGEDPFHTGDCRGNDYRWQDYLECVPLFKSALKSHLS